jgi:hypothetical protein
MTKNRRANSTTAEWAKLEPAIRPLWGDEVPWDPVYRHWIILSAFMRWCIARQIRLRQVNEETITGFIANKRRSSTTSRERTNRMRAAWNFAVEHVPGWPATTLGLLPRRDRFKAPIVVNARVVSLGREEFHPALRAQVSAYIENRGSLPADATEAGAKGSHRENMVARIQRLNSPQFGAKVFTVNRRAILTPDRRPKLTPR